MSEPVETPVVQRPRRDPAATRQLWAERLSRFRGSGLTAAKFCAAEGLALPTFYQWRRQLTSGDPGPARPTPLVPVRVAAPAAIELALPGGAVLRFTSIPSGTGKGLSFRMAGVNMITAMSPATG